MRLAEVLCASKEVTYVCINWRKIQKTVQFIWKWVNGVWFIEGEPWFCFHWGCWRVCRRTRSSARSFPPAEAAGARRRQSGLMKYSSLEFKASTAGPVKRWPRDGDVSRSFMTPESFLSPFSAALLMSGRQESLVSRRRSNFKQAAKFFFFFRDSPLIR